jgi:hypothetical protein
MGRVLWGKTHCYERTRDQGTLGSIAIAIVEPLGGRGRERTLGEHLTGNRNYLGLVSRDGALGKGARSKGARLHLGGLHAWRGEGGLQQRTKVLYMSGPSPIR